MNPHKHEFCLRLLLNPYREFMLKGFAIKVYAYVLSDWQAYGLLLLLMATKKIAIIYKTKYIRKSTKSAFEGQAITKIAKNAVNWPPYSTVPLKHIFPANNDHNAIFGHRPQNSIIIYEVYLQAIFDFFRFLKEKSGCVLPKGLWKELNVSREYWNCMLILPGTWLSKMKVQKNGMPVKNAGRLQKGWNENQLQLKAWFLETKRK